MKKTAQETNEAEENLFWKHPSIIYLLLTIALSLLLLVMGWYDLPGGSSEEQLSI